MLLQFRQSARPAATCQYLLTHSASLEAQFHAACTLREGVLREWASLTQAEVDAVRSFIMHYVIHGAAAAQPQAAAIRATLTAALAVITKRGWADQNADQKAVFLNELQRIVSTYSASTSAASTASTAAASAAPPGGGGSSSSAAQRASLELLAALVGEFNTASASPLGLSYEFHQRCALDMQAVYLKGFYSHGMFLLAATVSVLT